MTVLRVDQEMSRFARDRSATARTFEGSSFHRLVAHKVAAHHGLFSRTIIAQDGPDVALVEKPAGVDATPPPCPGAGSETAPARPRRAPRLGTPPTAPRAEAEAEVEVGGRRW